MDNKKVAKCFSKNIKKKYGHKLLKNNKKKTYNFVVQEFFSLFFEKTFLKNSILDIVKNVHYAKIEKSL